MDLDFLIYSSHKTSTQSLLKTLSHYNYKCCHCHSVDDLKITLPSLFRDVESQQKNFIPYLHNYKNVNNKKLKIITIIRNPNDRLISSFFQSFHSDEISFLGKNEDKTTIMVNDDEDLIKIYIKKIEDGSLSGKIESILEMEILFNINILDNLIKNENYYTFNHELFELFILDFKKIIADDNNLYINKCLNVNLSTIFSDNLTKDKIYYQKFINIKKLIPLEVNNKIKQEYKSIFSIFP
jgi:hypothetical protein